MVEPRLVVPVHEMPAPLQPTITLRSADEEPPIRLSSELLTWIPAPVMPVLVPSGWIDRKSVV